jgi:hypothetical protein
MATGKKVISVGCAKQRCLLANKKPIPYHACDDIDGKRLKQRIDKMKKIEDVLEELKRPRVSDVGCQAVTAFEKTPLKHCNATKLNLLIRCQHSLDHVKWADVNSRKHGNDGEWTGGEQHVFDWNRHHAS